MSRPEPLGVWFAGVQVAEFRARHPWDLRCVYLAEALDRWPGQAPLLSCSLPLQRRPLNASVFAGGLLPEGQHRLALAAELKVAAHDTYSLLKRFGRDVAGALTISVSEPDERSGGVMPYTAETLEAEVADLPDHPLGIHDDSELSIAGLQDKLLLIKLADGQWGRPIHGLPSTHILKLDDRQHPGLVEAEAQCLALARELGLTTVQAHIERIADTSCLIVERFDRRIAPDGKVFRIHQEDVCQALARDPEAAHGRGKYEDCGGPSYREVAELLDRYALEPQRELDKLVSVVTFTALIGNADAHGKNIALLHPTVETVELAPLYDTVPTALWPRLRTDGAMAINGRWALAQITAEDVAAEAASWRLNETRARRTAIDTAERLREAAAALDSDSPVARLVTERADRFLSC
jgi:serine/threonine-protein kinase HipA